MFRPGMDEIRILSKEYRMIPISTEISIDARTPMELLKILKTTYDYCFILESKGNRDFSDRYIFLGYDPMLELSCKDGIMNLKDFKSGENSSFKTANPKEYMKELMENYKTPKFSYLPHFTGGLFGYFAYDFIKYAEPSLKLDAEDEHDFKDLELMLFDKLIIFDKEENKIVIVANIETSMPEEGYERAKTDIDNIIGIINHTEESSLEEGRLLSGFEAQFDRKTYGEKVDRCRHYIREGDAFQIVISNCLKATFEGNLIGTYGRIRAMNPSPYMFYFSGDELEVAGASPESLVKLRNGILQTFPLAGTMPRGKDMQEDQDMEIKLMSDPKELAEHSMLVDLGRNDLGKVSRLGSVEVEKYMQVERFSHVMHIGSIVRGELAAPNTALDAIEAVLTAGTLSGAPKIRACEIITELENNKRGIYGGAIGYIDFAGDMDTCIAIRLAYKKGNKVFVRSGGGIVADSNPQSEYEEVINKAKAVVMALEMSREVK